MDAAFAQLLREAVRGEPTPAAHVEAGADNAALAWLAAEHPSATVTQRVDRRTIKKHLVAFGRYRALTQPAADAEPRVLLVAAVLRDPDFEAMDLNDPVAAPIFAALRVVQVWLDDGETRAEGLTAAQFGALQGLCRRPAHGWEAVGLPRLPTLTEISGAFAADRQARQEAHRQSAEFQAELSALEEGPGEGQDG